MKRVLLVLALVLALTGCGTGRPKMQAEGSGSVSAGYDWGITLSVKDVTPRGLTILCTQSGGRYTGLLMTGTPYSLDVWTGDGWQSVNTLSGEDTGIWTTVGLSIQANEVVEWPVKWTGLYGELSAGRYRISKSIIDQRGAGDYDTCTYYAEFEIP